MKTDPPRPRGRPRGFDRDAALDRALPVFWRQGYEGASIADLTAAMGITTPSLYGAFGSKERLYREVLDRYRADPRRAAPWAMTAPTARETVRQILESSARDFSDPAHPPGCMISTAVLTCAPENRPAAAAVTTMRGNTVARLRARFSRAVEEGELPPGTDPDELARFYGAIIQGLSVQALDGADYDALMKIVRRAMAAWPET
ncbi:TetR/AcrR family transcriptional regulator [Inquilinus limosus]|uniref:TetR family transcriptional regulator n=1 Tax=Inquilinus limosus TaxID=171674 RepID=A0A211ZG05_9PROT|nr:TetR/AcrR family transcriptional regulator [Inquilinus limosus]OWJ64104.1 TetR family transcriptional regulator [Inquilinus limosus]